MLYYGILEHCSEVFRIGTLELAILCSFISSVTSSQPASIADYDQKTLYEIENRYCTDPERMEVMIVRRMLEKVLHSTNSSGYGFPFSLKHLNFFIACTEADKNLADLSSKVIAGKSSALISMIRKDIGKIASNTS